MTTGNIGYVLWLGDRMIGTGGLFLPATASVDDVEQAVRQQAQESCKGHAVKFTVDGMTKTFPLFPIPRAEG